MLIIQSSFDWQSGFKGRSRDEIAGLLLDVEATFPLWCAPAEAFTGNRSSIVIPSSFIAGVL